MCILLSFIWSSLPLVGWSYYSLQESLTSCCIEWRDQSINVLSYNIVTFGVVYFVPLVLIISLNLKLIFMASLNCIRSFYRIFLIFYLKQKVKYLNHFVKDHHQEALVKKRISCERNMTLRNSIVIGSFIYFLIIII